MENKRKITLDTCDLELEMEPKDWRELEEMLMEQWTESVEEKNLREIATIFSLSTDRAELTMALERLDDYAAAEEQNHLFVLPVGLGVTLYGFDAEIQRIYKLLVSEIDFTVDGVYLKSSEYGPMVNMANFGKTLFRTKDEAIKKLVEALNDD